MDDMTMPGNDPQSPRGDATREALLVTAIEVFGREGFHAASTRAIAQEAAVNQALIGYHFRNKKGLYLAAFEHMAERIAERLGPAIAAVDAMLERPEPDLDSTARRATWRCCFR